MIDRKELARAFGGRIGEAAGRGKAEAAREARALAATWAPRGGDGVEQETT